ncbi:hypothetical protein ACGFZB_02435 [Streptomyces cinerochromogenes]|uniref:Uncharacterized protein n=1 Tax=Streptomyces cinerochromogenes TaxID=66422 RepID=A0ABW7AWQ4_9ACTN
MKKILVTSAIALSVLGITVATATADTRAPQTQRSVLADPACC